jgi:hypothetical protein
MTTTPNRKQLPDEGVLAWTLVGWLAVNLQRRYDFLNLDASKTEPQLALTAAVSRDLASLASGMVLPSESPDLSELEVRVLWGALKRVNADLVARLQAYSRQDNVSAMAKEDVTG